MKTSRTLSMNCCRQVVIKFSVEENEGLFEYRTAECILDWIDLLAFTAFHLSLDEDCNTAELL